MLKNNFLQRTLTGALFVGIVLASMLHPIAFAAVFLIFMILGLREFYTLVEQQGYKPQKIAGLVLAIALYVFAYFMLIDLVNNSSFFRLLGIGFFLLFLVVIFIMMFSILLVIELYRKKERPLDNVLVTFGAILYITFPFLLLMIFSREMVLALALFLIIWANDTFAYLTGMAFGKHRLFERISPKKSWEGSIGGFIFSMLVAYLFYYYTDNIMLLWQWFAYAGIIVIFGTFGDLAESMLKRSWNVKDSGNILPGHGGILDRFDSMLLAVPAVCAFLLIFNI